METSFRLRPQVPVYELVIGKISGLLELVSTIWSVGMDYMPDEKHHEKYKIKCNWITEVETLTKKSSRGDRVTSN
jgi:hypothetical protein